MSSTASTPISIDEIDGDPLAETGLTDPTLWFGFINLAQDEEFQEHRKNASDDLVCMIPRQPRNGPHWFVRTKPCKELKDYVLSSQIDTLQSWLAGINRDVCKEDSFFNALRLPEKHILDPYGIGHIAIPLFSQEKEITMICKDGRSFPLKWNPDQALYFTVVRLQAESQMTVLLIRFNYRHRGRKYNWDIYRPKGSPKEPIV
ncbi:hypothetical protein B0T10DRAFT_551468 [Thelonectria olida]|uniref:Uncharacterized protein n=1 Tax=Thelonectria olida TaxID=1576542 RepID=A0A9P8VVM9_9HYPO|nr:hypothetical protein B0T10DRAFT_551468 [Thelonectria olida]